MNKEEKSEYNRKYQLAHREQIAENQRRYQKQRRLQNPIFCTDCGKPVSLMARRCPGCHNRNNPYTRTPEIKEKNRIARRKRWSNVKIKVADMQAMVLGQHIKPNKCESELMLLLEKFFPHQWKFVGDGSFWVGELNPDFVATDGRKLAIDLFGSYWHNRPELPAYKTEAGRVKLMRNYGYENLIIWSHELNDADAVIGKIGCFTNK